MKKIILILVLFVLISGCVKQEVIKEGLISEPQVKETRPKATEEKPAEAPVEEAEQPETIPEEIPVEKPKEIPLSYHIENVPYYGEKNFCYGASAMMLVKYAGLTEQKVQEFRTAVKSGPGGPPDIFQGFQKFNIINKVYIGYSKNYVKKDADFYNQYLINSEEQVMIFNDKNEALEQLKKIVSSDILVMIVGHYGNHYLVVTGYDKDYIYINDPGLDTGYTYKDGSFSEKSKMSISHFLEQWTISKFEGGGVGFPGDYGMIWFGEKVDEPPTCEDYDNNKEECLLHKECEWIAEGNICEQI